MGRGIDTSPQKGLLHSNFGCCIGTIQKSATYKICGALAGQRASQNHLFVDSPSTPNAVSSNQAVTDTEYEGFVDSA